jgi:hypothetical protein
MLGSCKISAENILPVWLVTEELKRVRHKLMASSFVGNTGSTPGASKTFQPRGCGLISISVIVRVLSVGCIAWLDGMARLQIHSKVQDAGAFAEPQHGFCRQEGLARGSNQTGEPIFRAIFAVRRWLFFQEASFDELCDGLKGAGVAEKK